MEFKYVRSTVWLFQVCLKYCRCDRFKYVFLFFNREIRVYLLSFFAAKKQIVGGKASRSDKNHDGYSNHPPIVSNQEWPVHSWERDICLHWHRRQKRKAVRFDCQCGRKWSGSDSWAAAQSTNRDIFGNLPIRYGSFSPPLVYEFHSEKILEKNDKIGKQTYFNSLLAPSRPISACKTSICSFISVNLEAKLSRCWRNSPFVRNISSNSFSSCSIVSRIDCFLAWSWANCFFSPSTASL